MLQEISSTDESVLQIVLLSMKTDAEVLAVFLSSRLSATSIRFQLRIPIPTARSVAASVWTQGLF
jgi:hypothetical protein